MRRTGEILRSGLNREVARLASAIALVIRAMVCHEGVERRRWTRNRNRCHPREV